MTHGTAQSFDAGCRCIPCAEADRVRRHVARVQAAMEQLTSAIASALSTVPEPDPPAPPEPD